VGQVVNLRRIGNPPAEYCGNGRQRGPLAAAKRGPLAAASRGRINNPPQIANQIANLPHKEET
jgi:hypothetical protein